MKGKYKKNKGESYPGPGTYNGDSQKHLHKTPTWR